MVIGHYGAVIALKKVEPRLSLGLLMAAGAFSDILLGFTLLAGIERAERVPAATCMLSFNFYDYPYSHSLLGAVCAAVVIGLAYRAVPPDGGQARSRPAFFLGLAVLSHVPLDMIAHNADITLAGAGTVRIGLGLWNNIPATAVLELVLFAGGILAYTSATRPRAARDRMGLAALVVIALGFHVWSFSLFLVPGVTVLALLMFGFQPVYAALGWWIDRERVQVPPVGQTPVPLA